MDRTLIEMARRSAGLSQSELARLSGTAQSTISEYERRRKSPTLQVVERLLEAMDSVVMVIPTVEFDEHEDPELGTFFVADRLWALLPPLCMDRVRLHDRGGAPEGVWDLSDRADRILAYELLLCDGTADMIMSCVDGALLIDAWPEMDLPAAVREAWQPLIDKTRGTLPRRSTIRDADQPSGKRSS